jgi:hypothetical protein
MTDWPTYVGWYLSRRLVRSPGARLDCDALYAAWLAWWRDPAWWAQPPGDTPTVRQFGEALLPLCRLNRIPVAIVGRQAYCLDVAVTAPKAAKRPSLWHRVFG